VKSLRDLLPEILARIEEVNAFLVEAPPGTGKTTLIGPHLLEAPWLRGDILLVEPRRMAARAIARYLAQQRGENVGRTIGLRTRMETHVSPSTRLTVVTHGVYLRLIQADPALETTAVVIFDECHERSLNADLCLALTLDARATLRPDLRLLFLSATANAAALHRILPNLFCLSIEAPSLPVQTHYLPPPPGTPWFHHAARVIQSALPNTGTLLVFLPGRGEISCLAEELQDLLPPSVQVLPLHSTTPARLQDSALRPAPTGSKRVILATSIAETSLTIPDVHTVVDLGLSRVPRFHPGRGLTALTTVRAALATIVQRTGRAGRTAPGRCLRLWDPKDDINRPAAPKPEILEADLTRLALEVAVWGTDATRLTWLAPPPRAALAQAHELLLRLGALDHAGQPTPHGRELVQLPLHPRLGHMITTAPQGLRPTACALAALLEEGESVLRQAGDLRAAVELVRQPGPWKTLFLRLCRSHGLGPHPELVPAAAGDLALLAYPERLAGRTPDGTFRLASGAKAVRSSPHLPDAPWIVAPLVSGDAPNLRIYAAAPVDRETIVAVWGPELQIDTSLRLEGESGRVVVEERLRADAVILESQQRLPRPEECRQVIGGEIQRQGLGILSWPSHAKQLRARIHLAARLDPTAWPQWDDASLTASLDTWLGPALAQCTSLAEATAIDPAPLLEQWLVSTHGPQAMARLDATLPPHIRTPAGRLRQVDYIAPGGPRLAVRLQEMLGTTQVPCIAQGRVPLTVELLSPAGRPLALTQDLASFWSQVYPQVRKEMRGRYPKHPWPEDPTQPLPRPSAPKKR
jgi:ATP-dependent helicase HrpB